MKRPLSTCAIATAVALACANFAPPAVHQARAEGMSDSSAQKPASDGWITTKVKAELATTEGVKSTDISVNTSNGIVTLTGVLGTPLAVKKAIAAAESIQGVKKVDHSGLKSQ